MCIYIYIYIYIYYVRICSYFCIRMCEYLHIMVARHKEPRDHRAREQL